MNVFVNPAKPGLPRMVCEAIDTAGQVVGAVVYGAFNWFGYTWAEGDLRQELGETVKIRHRRISFAEVTRLEDEHYRQAMEEYIACHV